MPRWFGSRSSARTKGRVVAPVVSSGRITKVGNFQGYAANPYNAWTGMWGVNIPANDTLVATSSLDVDPATFPDGTIFTWNVTPDPDWSGVNGYLHVSYGNYDDSPGVITPRQVYTITDLDLIVDWTFSGSNGSGLLSECWLTPVATPSGSPTRLYEVAFFPKLSPAGVSYVNSLPNVGSGSFTDSGGIAWNVREGVSGTNQPYYIAYRPGNVDFKGTLRYDDYFAFLINSGKITGNEWFNGVAFGVEPHSGAGSLTIVDFAPSYAGAARVPWTITNLSAAVQSATTVNLSWRAAAGATSHQYRVNGGTWINTSSATAHTVTGLTASTAYTFEVRGVNATGNGVQSNTASATTTAAGATNLITNGGFVDDVGWNEFWYSGKTVSGGKANFTASPAFDGFNQAVPLTAGKYYELTYTVSGRVAPAVVYGRLRSASAAITNGTNRSANGTYTERLLAQAGATMLEFLLETGGTLSIDDVSLVGPYDTATVGGA